MRIGRHLIATGAAHKPDSDAYTLALVSHPQSFDLSSGPDGWRRMSVMEVLRRNPDLLVDDVWRVFEVEGGGENSLAAYDKYSSEENRWRAALVELSNDGSLDRERLLDASLDVLQRGFAPFRAQWFSAFDEAMRPTPAERTARASTYLSLAASPIGPTASMALKALGQIQKAGGLDPAEIVSQIGPALLAPSKGAAIQALALLSRAGEAEPGLRVDAAGVSVAALGHSSPDVQKSAAAQLRSWFPDAPDLLAASVRALGPGCHPTVRSDLRRGLATAIVVRSHGPYRRPALPGRVVGSRSSRGRCPTSTTCSSAPRLRSSHPALPTSSRRSSPRSRRRGMTPSPVSDVRSPWLDALRRCGALPVRRSSCSPGW